jgi:hypothetical protein
MKSSESQENGVRRGVFETVLQGKNPSQEASFFDPFLDEQKRDKRK